MSHGESHLVRYGNPNCLTDEIVTDAGQTDRRTDIASTRPVGFASGKNPVPKISRDCDHTSNGPPASGTFHMRCSLEPLIVLSWIQLKLTSLTQIMYLNLLCSPIMLMVSSYRTPLTRIFLSGRWRGRRKGWEGILQWRTWSCPGRVVTSAGNQVWKPWRESKSDANIAF